jgi:hypothetical protein
MESLDLDFWDPWIWNSGIPGSGILDSLDLEFWIPWIWNP